VVVAVAELDLQLDALEERRRRMEDEAVRTRRDVGELTDTSVGVRHARTDELVTAEELDVHSRSRLPCGGVEDVRGDRH